MLEVRQAGFAYQPLIF